MAGIQEAGRRDVLLTLLLGVVSIVAYLIYPVLNHGPGKIFLRTPLDRAIPLVPVMVIPYLSLIPLIVAAVVFAIADVRRVQALAVAVTLALVGVVLSSRECGCRILAGPRCWQDRGRRPACSGCG
jgi:hypothetical protein